jgi:hypothetical protein
MPALLLEQFARQVAGAAVAAAAVVELAGVGAGIGNQVGQAGDVVLFRRVGVHDQHVGHAHHLCDAGKVLASVVGHALEQPGVDRMRGRGRDADGVAVRRGLGHRVGANVAASAGLVLDDDGAQGVFGAFGQRTRRDVHRAARAVGDDKADGFGCVLRLRAGGKQRGGCGAGEEEGAKFHGLYCAKKSASTW